MTRRTILVVEDHIHIAETIELYLTRSNYSVIHLTEARCVCETQASSNVDLIILDIMLPDKSGLQVCKELRQQTKIPIIMLTAKSTERDIIAGLDAGADDYIVKPFSPNELIARVKSHLRREDGFNANPNIITYGALRLDLDRRSCLFEQQVIDLTKTEFDLLHFLIQKQGKVVTRNQIIDSVFGYDFRGTDRSIDTHLYNLRKKLEVFQFKPIITVHGIGYKIAQQDEIIDD